ncbi:diheme cytochrome c [Paracoccaceae bacterium Fryx2]|nr:diheme cytochrome c [Paracoccaceae bacterium Fryx2]
MIRPIALSLAFLASTLAPTLPALADDDGERVAAVSHAATQTECSACHMAFAPFFLPARSWKAMMGGLEDHFGENAQLDPATRADIEAYLVANAGDAGGRPNGLLRNVADTDVPLRITELPWFKREHDREVSPGMLAKAKSMANCVACHRGAERGSYEDD